MGFCRVLCKSRPEDSFEKRTSGNEPVSTLLISLCMSSCFTPVRNKRIK